MALSPASEKKLSTCHPDLIHLVKIVAVHMPITILCGHRDDLEQHLAFTSGKSKLDYPNSKHNSNPSRAVDMAPTPYNPTDLRHLLSFGGFVLGCASVLGLSVRWGGSWSRLPAPVDPLKDFSDLFHFELET